MSLESAIRENTAALQALTEALGRVPMRDDLEPVAVQQPAVSTPVGQAPTVDKPLSYDADVKPAVLRLAAKDKAELRRILDSYGVAKGSEVDEVNLPGFFARVQESL